MLRNCKLCENERVALMIDQGILIGRTDGMDRAVSSFLNRCRSASYFRQISEMPGDSEILPQIILVLQHWPEEYRRDEIDLLYASFPLARLICCYGPWCASDGRNNQLWSLSVRIPLEDVQLRIDAEVQVALGERAPLERTAGLDEVFEFDHSQ